MGLKCYLVSRKLAHLPVEGCLPGWVSRHIERCKHCCRESITYRKMKTALDGYAEYKETSRIEWAEMKSFLLEDTRPAPAPRRPLAYVTAMACAVVVIIGLAAATYVHYGNTPSAPAEKPKIAQVVIPPKDTEKPQRHPGSDVSEQKVSKQEQQKFVPKAQASKDKVVPMPKFDKPKPIHYQQPAPEVVADNTPKEEQNNSVPDKQEQEIATNNPESVSPELVLSREASYEAGKAIGARLSVIGTELSTIIANLRLPSSINIEIDLGHSPTPESSQLRSEYDSIIEV